MAATRPVALVTGASSGIGKETARAFATAGFEVIGTARNTARVTAPAGVTYLDLDVTSDESVASVVKQVIDRFGRIDVLVNNAGIMLREDLLDRAGLPVAEDHVTVNLLGT
ncbi:SDR family NAD(P)-dependent oxidoreductase, partial [Streptomyces coeruleorubidus]|uniref:SDR family NAD(P)-dependent oxidoreductase n=1 Tax=Streptomyces coeruleorubidus TaxID=116188 RepID=UPI0034068F60